MAYQINIVFLQVLKEARRIVVIVDLAVVDGQIESFDLVTDAEAEEEHGDRRQHELECD